MRFYSNPTCLLFFHAKKYWEMSYETSKSKSGTGNGKQEIDKGNWEDAFVFYESRIHSFTMAEKSSKFFLVFLFLITLQDFQKSKLQASPITDLSRCPKVKAMSEFNIFAVIYELSMDDSRRIFINVFFQMLGEWFVALYYSSSEETLTYHCMRVEFGLSRGNMDMRMRMRYRYANDPEDEVQTGNMTWQIPDPRRPEHWRHTEDNCKFI